MSVSLVKLHSAGTSGSATGTDRANASESYTVRYRVQVSSTLDTAMTVLNYFSATADLPYNGRKFKYGNDASAEHVCRSLNADYVEGSDGWFIVQASFDPADTGTPKESEQETGQTVDGKITENPLLWRDEISVAHTQYSEPMERALFVGANAPRLSAFLVPGRWQAVTNSAGVPFDPLPEVERHIRIIRITSNVGQFDNLLFDTFQGAVNTDNFVINKPEYAFRHPVKAYCGLLRLESEYQFVNGIFFWRQTKELWIHPRGWRPEILDRGLEQLLKPGDVDENGTSLSSGDFAANKPWDHKKIVDGDGYPTSAPALLDGNGKVLSMNPPAEPVWLTYTALNERAMAGVRW